VSPAIPPPIRLPGTLSSTRPPTFAALAIGKDPDDDLPVHQELPLDPAADEDGPALVNRAKMARKRRRRTFMAPSGNSHPVARARLNGVTR
jgi:hypothetical protein